MYSKGIKSREDGNKTSVCVCVCVCVSVSVCVSSVQQQQCSDIIRSR